MQTNQ